MPPRMLPAVALSAALIAVSGLACPPADLPVAISENALDSILDVCTQGAETQGCIGEPVQLRGFFGDFSQPCLRQRCDDGACGGESGCPGGATAREVRAAVRVALIARLGDEEPQPIAISRCIELGAQASGALVGKALADEFALAVDEALIGGVHYEDFEDLEDAYVLLGFFTWLEETPIAGIADSDGCTPGRLRVASELTRAGDSESLDVACASCANAQSVEFPSHCLDTLLEGSSSACFFDATAEVFGLCEPGGRWVTSVGAETCEAVVD
jgi:hypothetical protein